jgi:beta-glucanase (GH16 family)
MGPVWAAVIALLTAVFQAAPGVGTETAAGSDAIASGAAPANAAPWRLSWHQEFAGRRGTRLDPRQWIYDTGGEPQWGNEEWQYYAARSQNVSMDGHGHLAITARRERLPGMAHCPDGSCDITSARITTKGRFAQAYGRFEARIRIPTGAGMWPAFWMLGNNIDQVAWPASGEIDVMEVVGKQAGTVYGTIHALGYADIGIGGQTTLKRGKLSDAFHVYGIDWTPGAVTWTLDGRPYFTARRSQLKAGEGWPFDHPFYILLNLAVGGRWPGPPTTHTPFRTY